jgi:hypothetical protein
MKRSTAASGFHRHEHNIVMLAFTMAKEVVVLTSFSFSDAAGGLRSVRIGDSWQLLSRIGLSS